MKLILIVLTVSFSSIAHSQLESVVRKASMHSTVQRTEVVLGKNIKLPAEVYVNKKGNGSLSIENLEIKIVDEHDDGLVYGDKGLLFSLIDLDGDGIKEILISGVLVYTGEKESDPKEYSHFVRGYRYDTRTNKFNEILAIGSYEPNLNAD